jgi:hypothetical protein
MARNLYRFYLYTVFIAMLIFAALWAKSFARISKQAAPQKSTLQDVTYLQHRAVSSDARATAGSGLCEEDRG